MNRFYALLLLFSSTSVTSFTSLAQTVENITQCNVNLQRIGAPPQNLFYVSIKEPLSKPCKYSTLYCPISEPSCQGMLSIALTAQTVKKPISNLKYTFNSETQICNIWEVAVE